MQDLKVALIQSSIIWESFKDNIEIFNHKLDAIDKDTKLILLPEMFSTGFSMNAKKIAQKMDGEVVNWLTKKAKEKSIYIAGSTMINDQNKYFNRFILAKPDGSLEFYDKKHLFSLAGENNVYSSGNERVIVECLGWKICPFICYDLRFPLWNKNINNEYDIALFVANWPSSRSYAWKALLVARAIENQCYVLGVNRVGIDGNNIEYTGDSLVINPMGQIISFASLEETIIKTTLSYKFLEDFRRDFPFWMDADIG